MVQTLESIKGGGGSIKVGTTGTISALMSRELEPTKSSHSVSAGESETTPRKPKPKTSSDEASSSSSRSVKNHRGPETVKRAKQSSHQVPMLIAGDASIDGTPIRQKKPVKKGPSIVEIVDIKCGNPDKAWVGPITNRLRKLGFSKLSENTGNSSPSRV